MVTYTTAYWKNHPASKIIWKIETFRILGIPLWKKWTQLTYDY